MVPPSGETSTPNHEAFLSFYDTYAPKLWGLILAANLSATQSEAILMNTLTKAWQQFGPHLFREKYVLTQLLQTACGEGLPAECLQAIVKSKL